MIKKIKLTKGKFALIDSEDLELLEKRKWQYHNGYATRTDLIYKDLIPTKRGVAMHRLIMGLKFGDKREVDHINHNLIDNRRSNLRVVEHWQNCLNIKKANYPKSSKHKGVTFDKISGGWRAQISFRRKHTYIGYFNKEIDAARAYDKVAKELFGEFAYPNLHE